MLVTLIMLIKIFKEKAARGRNVSHEGPQNIKGKG